MKIGVEIREEGVLPKTQKIGICSQRWTSIRRHSYNSHDEITGLTKPTVYRMLPDVFCTKNMILYHLEED